jgi:arsenite/tail-anchored protein-transporting ATPase
MSHLSPFDALQLIMFSGKGGVGKTTLSCSLSRHWAQQFPQQKVLLLSTDPAHSLGDVLQTVVTDTPRSLPDLANLQVRALDAEALLSSFKTRYGTVLELLVERGSFVEGEDLAPVWNLNFPGLDELMAILEIQRILRQQEADRVIVDMAPSGHTLNLFGLMDFLDRFLQSLDLFQEKHRVISQTFTGKYTPDAADAFIVEMKDDLATGRRILQDAVRTACFVVGIAEPMSYLESGRFVDALQELGIPFGGAFVNQVSIEPMISEQQETLEKFHRLVDGLPLFILPRQTQEPVGAIALDQLPQQLQSYQPVAVPQALRADPITLNATTLNATTNQRFPDFLAEGKKLILVGGKGGVGKTTVSAAIAWAMATRHPGQNIRVISIDPAHSLGDAFGCSLGHTATQLATNLTAQEIDAKVVLEQFRQDYLYELAEMMSGENGKDDGLELQYTPQAWRQLVAQALPGIDEMLSLVTMMDLLESGEQDLIIIDTAPTGHLLRFLEMPEALSDWLAWIFKLWIKYQDVIGRTEFMGRLRSLRQKVMKAQKKLTDPSHTEFIGVLQAKSAIIAEAERLTQTLATMEVNQRFIVHNRFEVGQCIPMDLFPHQTAVQLPQISRAIAPMAQIQQASEQLFLDVPRA